MRFLSAEPSLARWRVAVAVWLLAWVIVVLLAWASGLGAVVAVMIAFGLGRNGGPNDWNRRPSG